jgi:hypothetical protein
MHKPLYQHLSMLKFMSMLKFIALTVASLLTLTFGPATVWAEDAKPISGNYTATYVFQEAMPVPDAKGHVLMLVETHANNKNTGPTDFLEGAKVVNREIRDLVQGNGTHNGYITFTDNQGEITAKWDGNVKTTLTEYGQPRTTFNGDWTWTKATGRYVKYTASGKYTGYAPSPDKVYIEWEGQLLPR